MPKRLIFPSIAAIILSFLVGAFKPQSGQGTALVQQTSCKNFPETGQRVCGKFLTYWMAHGGLAQQGYPLTNEFTEPSEIDGKTYTVQYFERAVFELHPENHPPNDVLLTLLGDIFYRQRYPNGAPELPAPLNPVAGLTFPQTGKWIRGVFLDYWKAHGGVPQQGYPISNPFNEKSAVDGKTYTVQYFERAVFELHTENQPPYDLLLSQLGTLQLKRKYSGGVPGAATPTPSTDAWTTLAQRPLKITTLAPGSPCPTSGGKMVAPDFGLALGDGPVYPTGFSSDAVYYYGSALQEGGWYLLKVLWIASPNYRGPALVRGKQIDGPNELRFKEGADPPKELRLDTSDTNNRTDQGWSNWPTYTRLRAPGCYAYQVDGVSFSQVIIFRASNAFPPPPKR